MRLQRNLHNQRIATETMGSRGEPAPASPLLWLSSISVLMAAHNDAAWGQTAVLLF